MNIIQIEKNLQELLKSFNEETFIYDLLLAYGTPKSTIVRLQKGGLNLSKNDDEISWKKKLFFKTVNNHDVHEIIEAIRIDANATKHDPRFIVITDFTTLLSIDTKTKDTLDIPIGNIAKHFDFFLPLAGMEKAQHQNENPADVKAAEKMAKLYDEIKKDNPTQTEEEVHNLNVFLSRLLFCFFAEDTGIFQKGQFTSGISSHTQQDGGDLASYLNKLFEVLNTDSNLRDQIPAYLAAFPYVNGGLFRNAHVAPNFTRRSRQAIIECGELDWSAINPDIFGSMIQAVITPEHRGGLGMHYTSVPNIMKVIEPLFLTELQDEFKGAEYEPKRLNKLLERIGKLKIFDPACGSGNFLIIAYKELRLLEIKILQQLQTLQQVATGFEKQQLELIPKAQLTLAASYQQSFFSRVELSQFYGIELDDFAHEIATLSLWLAQHQLNMKFKEVFGITNPTLPLRVGGNIVHGNATRLDWEVVCSKKGGDEVYILGNPPYLGFNMQSVVQKEDIACVYPVPENMKFLDYISCWFLKASQYIDEDSQFAFVSTNSICQGTQVPMVWPEVFKYGLEIAFAYPEFVWSNNAKQNAGVICSIIGVRKINLNRKFIFQNSKRIEVKNINAYLINGSNIIIEKRQKPLSKLSSIATGNIPYDGGNLILSEDEAGQMIENYPQAEKFIKKLSGSYEYINNHTRYCLWINSDDELEANMIPPIKERVELVKLSRLKGGKIAKNYVNVPYRFYMINRAINNQILIPRVSSIRRKYIPTGFLDSNTIISDSAQAIYDPEVYVFGVINSHMHMTWVRAVAGRLKSDYRYSAVICYNTFPFPDIVDVKKKELERHVYEVLSERENHSEKTLAQLYDPDKMPDGLREAHHQLDLAIERCYRSKPFETDEERLEYLFKLYEKMIAEEKEKDTLFQKESKTKKRKDGVD
ncbi:MAG: class I SAM-dependent DNA methyltransferase [Flavobacterium sp.]|nr:MAG: class I SAM-dependent DNA methyltransferase [Flavobacterium sp.]